MEDRFAFLECHQGVCGFNFTKANVDDMVAAAKSKAADKSILGRLACGVIGSMASSWIATSLVNGELKDIFLYLHNMYLHLL